MTRQHSIAVAIFVKTPGCSPVKTRLSAEVGIEQAERCYRASVRAVEAVVRAARDRSSMSIVPYWSVAESSGMSDPLWSRFERIPQPDGGLGNRLALIHEQLIARHQGVIFLGADAPQITTDLIERAVAEMLGTPSEKNRWIIGPADDGGFYLFGGCTPLPRSVWLNVEYSSSTTCEQLCRELQHFGECRFLPTLCDIDNKATLLQVVRTLLANDGSASRWLVEQRELSLEFRHLLIDDEKSRG